MTRDVPPHQSTAPTMSDRETEHALRQIKRRIQRSVESVSPALDRTQARQLLAEQFALKKAQRTS